MRLPYQSARTLTEPALSLNPLSDAAVRDAYRVLRELADAPDLVEDLRAAEEAYNRCVYAAVCLCVCVC